MIVQGTALQIKEYRGKRVVTFKDIDTVHKRPEGTARKRFNDNRRHFVSGVDFFKISPSEFRTAIGNMDSRQQNEVTLMTETGYLMLVKSFTDDLAWKVQRELVKMQRIPNVLPIFKTNTNSERF
ncbi:MAG: ORF6N domain-containing protein [Oliverpabstia sp.]|nr:ORF6N domain-containing protein [Oliverpabstia sp.]